MDKENDQAKIIRKLLTKNRMKQGEMYYPILKRIRDERYITKPILVNMIKDCQSNENGKGNHGFYQTYVLGHKSITPILALSSNLDLECDVVTLNEELESRIFLVYLNSIEKFMYKGN